MVDGVPPYEVFQGQSMGLVTQKGLESVSSGSTLPEFLAGAGCVTKVLMIQMTENFPCHIQGQ